MLPPEKEFAPGREQTSDHPRREPNTTGAVIYAGFAVPAFGAKGADARNRCEIDSLSPEDRERCESYCAPA